MAKRRADYILSKNTVISLVKLVLPFILISFFRSFGIVSSWGIATCITVVIYLFLFLPKVQGGYKPKFRIDFSIIKNFWKYSAGNYFSGLLASIYGPILPIIIVNRLGAEENANFFVAWMIAGLLFVIPNSITHSLFAEGSHSEKELDTLMIKSFKFILLLSIPAIIILWFLGKWLLLIFGESFTDSALSLLKVLTLSAIPTGVNAVYFTILRVEHKIKELILMSGLITTATLAGSYLTIQSFGILGTGYTYLFVQGIVSIYALLVMRSFKYRGRVNRNEPNN